MIYQQICLKKKEYTLIFKFNGRLNYGDVNGKIMGLKVTNYNKKIIKNYNLEIVNFTSSAVASQYTLANDFLFASLITLITGSVLEG